MGSEKDHINSQESNAHAVKQKSRMPRPRPLNIGQNKPKSKTNVLAPNYAEKIQLGSNLGVLGVSPLTQLADHVMMRE